jgi:hypothetical protein
MAVHKYDTARVEAVVCGLHARLGAHSLVYWLTPELVRAILQDELSRSKTAVPTRNVRWSSQVPWHAYQAPTDRVFSNLETNGPSGLCFRMTGGGRVVDGAVPRCVEQRSGTVHYFGERKGVRRLVASFTLNAQGQLTLVLRELLVRQCHILLHAEASLRVGRLTGWQSFEFELFDPISAAQAP